jgi:putative oxidoreductase
MKYLVLLGRIFYVFIFLNAAPGLFSKGSVDYAAGHGVPLASIAVPLSGVLAVLGGLSIAVGLKAKWGGWFLVAFLVPVTFMMHNFWAMTDPAAAKMNEDSFIRNLSFLGCALLVTHFGAGPVSLDSWLASRRTKSIEAAAR